jgi:site-specific recombinase XerD
VLYLISLTTGMRVPRLLSLHIDELRLTDRMIRLDISMIKNTRVRSVWLPAPVRHRLEAHLDTRLAMRRSAGSKWQECGLVFCNSLGGAICGAQLNHAFHSLLAAAGLPKFGQHALRQSYAHISIAAGVDPTLVARQMGTQTITAGANLSYTAKAYLHAADLLGRILFRDEA